MADSLHFTDQLQQLKDLLASREIQRWKNVDPSLMIDEHYIKEQVGVEFVEWIISRDWHVTSQDIHQQIFARTRYWLIKSIVYDSWSRASDFVKHYYNAMESRLDTDQFTALCLNMVFHYSDKHIGAFMGHSRSWARQRIIDGMAEFTGLPVEDVRQELRRIKASEQSAERREDRGQPSEQ